MNIENKLGKKEEMSKVGSNDNKMIKFQERKEQITDILR